MKQFSKRVELFLDDEEWKKKKKEKRKKGAFWPFVANTADLINNFNWKLDWSWPVACCIIWPAFRCCAHPKAGWNTFFQPVFRNCLAPAEKLKPEPNFCKLQKSKFSHPYQKCFWNFFEKESHFFSVKREIYCYFTRRLTSLQKEITFTTK